jgi:hypothetical protein
VAEKGEMERQVRELEDGLGELRRDLNEVIRTTGIWLAALVEFTGCPAPPELRRAAPRR